MITKGTSERVLRSLVPEEQWPSPSAFWIDTPTHGKWVVDLNNLSCIFMAVSREVEQPSCDCPDCTTTLSKQTAVYGIPPTFWLRPRGILLDIPNHASDFYTWEAKVARALSIVLLLTTDPATVNAMCCG